MSATRPADHTERTAVLNWREILTEMELARLASILRRALWDIEDHGVPCERTWVELIGLHVEVRTQYISAIVQA